MKMETILRSTIAALTLSASMAATAGDGGKKGSQTAIQGPWQVTITPVDCADGTPLPVRILSYVTFAAGGTLTEATSGIAFDPGQRSGGQGYWQYTGRNTYLAHYQAFVLFDSAGGRYVHGTQTFDHSVEMQDRDHWTSDLRVTFRDSAGDQVPPSGCATAAAVRMR
jgi:hypothetical protein